MAKNKNNSIAAFKSVFCMALVSALLVCSFAINFGASAAESNVNNDYVGAIKVNDQRYAPYFGQTVYLKPDTQYTFSYKYSADIADAVVIRYYSSNIEGTDFPEISDPVYDTYYNMVTYTFKTLPLGTADIVTDETESLIKSYIGIRVWNDLKYSMYDFVFADFQLLENGTGANCFEDPKFDSIQAAAGDTTAKWGAIDRNQSGQISTLCYPRYYIDGVNPIRSDFVSTPNDEAVQCKGDWSYLVQNVWLKPATRYVFSYYYSDVPAAAFVYCNPESETIADQNFTSSYDSIWKKVSYEFTTVDIDDANATLNPDGTLVQAIIGIRSGGNNKESYFAGFDLFEAGDDSMKNLLNDTKFRSIGSFSDGQIWGTFWPTISTSANYKRVDYNAELSDDAFKIVNEISIGSITHGKVTASQTQLTIGDEVTFTVTPDAGYELLELIVNGKPVPCMSGVYRLEFSEYYFDPSTGGKVNVSAIFIEENTMPSITNTGDKWARAIAQKLWLEPDTAYIFSYHYSSAPASGMRVGYTDKSGQKFNIDIDEAYIQKIEPDSSEYHTESFMFLTPGLDAENVVVGEGQNKGLVECAVGLLFDGENDPSEPGERLFGGLTCYKADDPYKTNLFVNRDFSKLEGLNSYDGKWKSYYKSVEPFQICTKFDADETTDGRQHPNADLFRNKILGDCNRDGKTNITDLVRLKKYIATLTADIDLENADMNGDNNVDVLDLASLRKTILEIS